MSLRLRKTFFYICLVAFVGVGGWLVLFTRGLVFDLQRFELIPTGALYLRFTPSDATLLVNGEARSVGANILSPGTFVDNLRPGSYTVTVARQGYSSWTKTLTVASSRVTSASSITLWPAHAPATVVARGVTGFWLTAEGAVLEDLPTASGTRAGPAGGLHLANKAIRGSDVVESDPGTARLVTEDGGQFFLADLSELDASTNVSALFTSLRSRLPAAMATSTATGAERVRAVLLHPFSGQKLLIGTDAGLYELDMKKVSLDRLASADRFTALAKSGGDAFIMNGSSTVVAVNLVLRTNVAYAFPIPTGLKTLAVSSNGTYIAAVSDRGDLTVLDRTTGTLAPVSRSVTAVTFSSDLTSIVFLTADGRLNQYYLKDVAGDELLAAGTLAVSPNPLPIASSAELSAFPNFPGIVLVHSKGALFAVETDLRSQVNSTGLASNVSRFAVRGAVLYILSADGTLSSVDLAP